jgi:hypothetical protein
MAKLSRDFRRRHIELHDDFSTVLGIGGGAAFTPASLPNLVAWYDPSDLTAMTVATDGTGGNPAQGDAIGRMLDQSGNNHHAIAPSAASRATLGAGGLVEYDHVDDAYIVDLPEITSGHAWIVTGSEISIWPIHTAGGDYRLMRADARGWGIIDRELTALEIADLEAFYIATAIVYAFVGALRGGTSAYLDLDAVGGTTVNWGDGTTEAIASGVATTHTYSSDYAGLVRVEASNQITSFDARSASWDFMLQDFPGTATAVYFVGNAMTISGDLGGISQATTVFISGSAMTISGDLGGISQATYVYFVGNAMTISGDLGGISQATFAHFIGNAMTISGDLGGISQATYVLMIGNAMTISGDLGGISQATYVYFVGNAMTVSSNGAPRTTASMQQIRIEANLSSGAVDNILTHAAGVATWTNNQLVDLDGGGNAARTSASDTAVATLEGNGVTVQTA